jgi:hypothetical protein
VEAYHSDKKKYGKTIHAYIRAQAKFREYLEKL